MFVVTFLETVYHTTVPSFGFCNTRNNQGLGECYQLQPLARLTTFTSTSRKYLFTNKMSDRSIPVKSIVSCLAREKGILLTSRDSGNNGPGIKNAYQCVKLICK